MHVLYYWYSIYGSTKVLPEVLPYLEVQRTRTYGNRTEIDILFPEVALRRYSTVSYFVRVLPEVLSYFRTVHVLSCTVHTRTVSTIYDSCFISTRTVRCSLHVRVAITV